MQFSESIVEHGTKAVRAYREISGIKNDNELPEVFLGSWIAKGLYNNYKLHNIHARIEYSYTKLAEELGLLNDKELVNIMGSYKADIAIYEKLKPKAIVEIKIFDERNSKEAILSDSEKMQKLSRRVQIDTYLAILLTDTITKECDIRRKDLIASLEHIHCSEGNLVPACEGSADWKWQFLCFAINKSA